MKRKSVSLPMTVLAVTLAVVLFSGCVSTPASAPASASAARQYASVTFRNITGETIFYLYISDSTDEYWGDDRLGAEVLSNNETFTARLLTGKYDIKATDLHEDAVYTFRIEVDAGGGTWSIEPSDRDTPASSTSASSRSAPSSGQYTNITFRNITGETLYYLYIYKDGTDPFFEDWGEDWLGSEVLSNNKTFTARLTTGKYCVVATDRNEDNIYWYTIEVDAVSKTYTIGPEDIDLDW